MHRLIWLCWLGTIPFHIKCLTALPCLAPANPNPPLPQYPEREEYEKKSSHLRGRDAWLVDRVVREFTTAYAQVGWALGLGGLLWGSWHPTFGGLLWGSWHPTIVGLLWGSWHLTIGGLLCGSWHPTIGGLLHSEWSLSQSRRLS